MYIKFLKFKVCQAALGHGRTQHQLKDITTLILLKDQWESKHLHPLQKGSMRWQQGYWIICLNVLRLLFNSVIQADPWVYFYNTCTRRVWFEYFDSELLYVNYRNLFRIIVLQDTHLLDPQANNVRLECSAPLSNECLLLKKIKTTLPPLFSRADLPVRNRSLHLLGVQKCFRC